MNSQLTGEQSLLDPILFDTFADASRFANSNFCSLCRGSLQPIPTSAGYILRCRICSAKIIEGSYISKHTLGTIESDDMVTQIETRATREVSEAQLLKELGF